MTIRRFAAIIFGIALLMQFNNCSNVMDHPGLDDNSILSQCSSTSLSTNCALPDNGNLLIAPGGDQHINAGIADFDIDGTCNEAGYPNNVIIWTLKLENVAKRNSGMLYGGYPMSTRCVNGHFQLTVILVPLDNDDKVNRTGLFSPEYNSRVNYTLEMTIFGYDSSGVPHQNAVNGTRTINLNPQ